MEYADWLPDVRKSHPALAARIESFIGLEQVLDWLKADNYPLGQLDMITQDEFCHDLLIPIRESSDVLVFGMT